MNSVFAPAVRLLNQLKYPRKFGLIGLLFALPFGLVTCFWVREINDRIAFTAKELLGNEYLRPVQQFASDLRDHRELIGDRSDQQSTPEELRRINERLQHDIQDIDAVDHKLGTTLQTTSLWAAIKNKFQALNGRPGTADPADSANRHTELIADVLSLISQAGDQSNLILDPELDSFYLMDVVVNRLPLLTEQIGQARGFSTGMAIREATNELDQFRLRELTTDIKSLQQTLTHHFEVAVWETHYSTLSENLKPALQRSIAATNRFLELTTRLTEPGQKARASADEVWQPGSEALAECDTLYSLTSAALDRLLQARVSALANRRFFVAAVTCVCVLLVVYLFIAFYLAVMQTVAQLDAASVRLLGGSSDDAGIHVDTRDELGQITRSFGSLAARLKTESLSLRNSEQRIRVILEHAAYAIIATTPEGIITTFNPAAVRLLGYSAEELVGRQTPAAFHLKEEIVARAREFGRELGVSLEPGFEVFVAKSRRNLPNEHEWTYVRKDGSRIAVLLGITALRDAAGQITGFLGIANDITERKSAAAALKRALDDAEQANRAKSEFLANMSHEIRTPMNGILGFTELVLDTSLTNEQREYLETVQASTSLLLRIINDILDFSKIEAGKLELDLHPFLLRENLGDTLKTLAMRAHEKDLELTWHTPPEIPDCLVGDAGRLRQILVNLTGNAIKFTSRGEVGVTVELVSRTASRACLRFCVRDTGIGIPQAKQSQIFEAFTQADTSTTRSYGGTGLGLSISRQLVRMMGGELCLTSEEGSGSTFFFTLELPIAQELPESSAEECNVDLTGIRVLVVDDNETNREILKEVLRGWKMQPCAVGSGAAGLEAMRCADADGLPFTLVLTDCHMPEMDGFMFVEKLKQQPNFARATIMMLTSAERQGGYARCQELGIAATVLKPLKQSELKQAIISVLDWTGRPADEPTSTQTSTRPASSRSLRVLLAEDNEVNQKVATRMLEKLGHSLRIVANGQLALDAWQGDRFDVVLMDVQMPVMDGFEAAATIRKLEQGTGRHQPIIGLTAHAMSGDRERCLAAGMDDYVSKPIRAERLVEALSQVANRPDSPGGTVSANTAAVVQGDSEENDRVFDLDAALAMVDGEQGFLKELIDLFLSTIPDQLLSLKIALEQNDLRAVGESAHAIKGVIGNFCAPPAFEAALDLERTAVLGETSALPQAHQSLLEKVDRLVRVLKKASEQLR